ncbi:uncharacterized protein [Centroberyx affinis]|uniref:uncharacterized protein n=1 Tax=Centroberyx affinis TaxID=166261 RepID=UPI003A5C2AF3
MPKSCCVPCCTNNTRKNNGVKFFCVPKDGKRRMKWFQSIRREDGPGKLWAPASKHIYVCSIHFVTGIKSNDPLNPDYTPTLFPHLSERERQRAVYRQKKFETNRQLNRKRAAALAGGVSPKKDKTGLKLHTASPSFIDRCGWSEVEHDYCISRVKRSNTPASSPDPEASGRPEPSGLPAQGTENRTERASPEPCANESCQTALKEANDECRALRAELSELRDRTKRTTFSEEAFEEDEEEEEEEEEKVRELTGLPSRAELMSVFTALTPGGTFQNFILTLMHLKLNLPFQFFMHVLLISKSAASLMFSKTLDLLHDGLSAFIRWPSKEPTSGDHSEYSKNRTATVAIDCFEILVETQSHPGGTASRL